MNIFPTLLREIEEGREVTFATVIEGKGRSGTHLLYDKAGQQLQTDPETKVEIPFDSLQQQGLREVATKDGLMKVMVERITPAPTIIIFGSGHIAECLASLGKWLSFRVVVVDDRPEYLNKDRFPKADQIFCGDFNQIMEKVPFHSTCYSIIVTRGHQTDAVCLEHLVKMNIPYIGLVGSKRKIRFIHQLLSKKGIDLTSERNLHAPIGLDFHSETPEEIAFSILAEIEMIRSKGTGRPLSLLQQTGKVHPIENNRMRPDIELFRMMSEALDQGRSFASVVILETEGHVPRGVGCRALVWEDGSIFRTIGGGRRESEMIPMALSCLETKRTRCHSIDFSGSYDDFQPVCGGRLTYFIQPYHSPISFGG